MEEQAQVDEAIAYNKRKAGKLWTQDQLPWPLSSDYLLSVDTKAFAIAVGMFQGMHGLTPDGQLGPATFALIRSIKPAIQESEAAHDFEYEDDEEEETVASFEAEKVSFEPARTGVSNCLIIAGQSIMLPDEMLALGITASNYDADGEKFFDQHRKRTEVSHFVIHESVTMSTAQTNKILDRKRERSGKKGQNGRKGWDFGIHLNMAPDGHITCHADLVFHRLVQANQLNDTSTGIEVVNPYNPKFAKPPFTETIPGPWWCWKPRNAQRVYTLPTPPQLRAMGPLCKLLSDVIPGLPFAFPTAGLDRRQKRIKNWNKRGMPAPGIVAHRVFASHADGRYLLEHVMEEYGVNA